jgi:hypothetical protein
MASPETVVVPIAAVRITRVNLVANFGMACLPITFPLLSVVNSVGTILSQISAPLLAIVGAAGTVFARALASPGTFARARSGWQLTGLWWAIL